MATAAVLWEQYVAHVAGCVHCDPGPCRVAAELKAEFDEQANTETYAKHPDPARAGLEAMQAEGTARIIRVTPAQMEAIKAIPYTDAEPFYAALQAILDEATFQSLAKTGIDDIQFETEGEDE